MNTKLIKDTRGFVDDFLQEYLSDGLGAKTKREIDILIMNLLMNYAGFDAKSNQDLSILLQAPESKIKNLRYEARLKYPPDEGYIKREFLYTLTRSQFDFEKRTITFVMEDQYLRYAIQGLLKSKGMFADSSFNAELVKINRGSLESVIEALYGKQIAGDFRSGFDAMVDQVEGKHVNATTAFSDTIIAFVWGAAEKLAFDIIKSRIGF